MLLLAALVLTSAACLRSAEYDEQYTLFLTAGTPRPNWPTTVFPAGDVALVQAGHATLGGIARDLRATDVHPPLYFWTVSLWRLVFGPGLFAARMLSVLCGTVSIALVGIIANRRAIRPWVAMLLTLGCYGFVYTNAIARGFAMAEMLTLCGLVLLLGGRHVLAGVCLGAALCCNYLAVFVGGAVLLVADAWVAILAVIPFLGLDAWFFVAQHAARMGQFPPFAAWPSLVRLAEYQVAVVFGGLPLYVGPWGMAIRGESRARRGCRCAGSGRRPCQTAGSQSGARRGDRSTTGIVSSRRRVQHHAHRVAISDLRLAIRRVVGSGEFADGWERPVCISYSPPVTSNRQHRWPAVFAADDATGPVRRG